MFFHKLFRRDDPGTDTCFPGSLCAAYGLWRPDPNLFRQDQLIAAHRRETILTMLR